MDTDGDGLPDNWEKSHKLDASDPNDAQRIVLAETSAEDRHLGYSYLEFYLNELAENLVK